MRYLTLGGERRRLRYSFKAWAHLEEVFDVRSFVDLWEKSGPLGIDDLPGIHTTALFLQAGMLAHYGLVDVATILAWLDDAGHSVAHLWRCINAAMMAGQAEMESGAGKKKRRFPGILSGGRPGKWD
jgi:hypothetical protein